MQEMQYIIFYYHLISPYMFSEIYLFSPSSRSNFDIKMQKKLSFPEELRGIQFKEI